MLDHVKLPALPAGLTARPPRLPDDAAAITRLARAYDERFMQRPSEPPQELVVQIERLPSAGLHDVLLIEDVGPGRPAGPAPLIGLIVFEPATGSAAQAELPEHWFDVFVDPARSTGELARVLVAAALEHAAGLLAHEGHPRVRLASGLVRGDRHTEQALLAGGFHHDRTFWGMECRLGPEAADPGPPPAGVRVRLCQDGPADRALLHRLTETAFADHWNHIPVTDQEWWQRMDARTGVDPTQWWVAELHHERGVERLGVCVGETSRAEFGGGYVAILGVLRPARGRGIAKHLLRVAFAEHHRRGWSWTALRVDSDSPTGATALYRSVGMEPVEVFDLYAREIVADPTTRVPW
jgi:GNAT superfamily N-acetyltransferase